jgi:hypothetical protein
VGRSVDRACVLGGFWFSAWTGLRPLGIARKTAFAVPPFARPYSHVAPKHDVAHLLGEVKTRAHFSIPVLFGLGNRESAQHDPGPPSCYTSLGRATHDLSSENDSPTVALPGRSLSGCTPATRGAFFVVLVRFGSHDVPRQIPAVSSSSASAAATPRSR